MSCSKRGRVVLPVLLTLALAVPACSRGGGAGPAVPTVAVDPDSTSATDRAIADAQARLRDDPDDPDAQLDLAQAVLRKVRETADPTLYAKAGQLLDLVAERSPDDPRLLVTQGTLALARHRFPAALAIGRRALELAPENEAAHGVVVDAYNELGRYDDALDATDAMLQVRPDLAALSRASYARELRGDLDGAILAMTEAVTAGSASGGGEDLAAVQVLLGDLLLTRGDLAQAAVAYDDAERSFPGLPGVTAGRSRLLIAQGRYGEAGDLLGDLLEVQPLAEHAVLQGDAYEAAGRADDAEDAFALVDTIARRYEENGVDVDLELSYFYAERRPGEESVEQARQALKARPGIFGHDALAWNLYRAGDMEQALMEMQAALSTGSVDPQLRFHAAAIADATGARNDAAEHLTLVLGTNPRFSPVLVDDIERLAGRYGLPMPPPPVLT